MKTLFTVIALTLLIACHHRAHTVANRTGSNTLSGIYSNAIGTLEDGIQREFLYFDGKGYVYYMIDTAYQPEVQIKRVNDYATKSIFSLVKTSITFQLDSFYIGTETFSTTVFDNKTINGKDKIYYHELQHSYSGTYIGDTLKLALVSISMHKDTSRSNVTYIKYNPK